MRKATRFITLLALLCIWLFIGYLWNDHKENAEPVVIEQEEILEDDGVVNTTGDDSITISWAVVDDDIEDASEDDEEETDSELTGEDIITYEPLIVNDNDTAFEVEEYPAFDDTFDPELENESGTAPHITWTNETTEPLTEWFKLTGKVTSDVERIDVIRNGDMTPFTLQKFTPWMTEFEYNMNPAYDNLTDWTNYYLIRAYAKDNLYQKVIEVEYQSAPSAEELDDAFRS
jgi:hypothetical protein